FQCLICLLEGEYLDGGPHGHLRREGKEFVSIASGEVCDGAKAALLPKEFVRKGGQVAHVDVAADDGAALADGFERQGNELARGREDDGAVQPLRRRGVRGAGPNGSQGPGELLSLAVASARERID